MTSENMKTFESPTTGKMCDAAQYIAEVMCIRMAAKDQVSGLEHKFWNKSRKLEFQSQVVAARRLIKRFGQKAVLQYINTDGKFLYSLGKFNTPKFIIDALTKFSANLVEDVIVSDDKVIAPTTRGKRIVKNGLFSKIKKAQNKDGEE